MAGKLYLVGTPIGNLADFSPRARQTLEEADFIAAEDTRVTRKLLSHFSIHRPLVSYHEHNKSRSGEAIFQRIAAGETCALVTDAGMPCLSDPGADLVRLCAENGIPVTTVPGPSAAVSALVLSGLDTGRFTFEGFLSTANKKRLEHLASLQEETRTMIFYEAPHKLLRTLQDFEAVFGPERRIALCRELTKVHEEVCRTTVGEALQYYSGEAEPRGEYVLILAGAEKKMEPVQSLPEALAELSRRREQGEPLRKACRAVSEETGIPINKLYRAALDEEKDG
jgi:16S rRNA (cytidine1402-2'-O)-methyltransferase